MMCNQFKVTNLPFAGETLVYAKRKVSERIRFLRKGVLFHLNSAGVRIAPG